MAMSQISIGHVLCVFLHRSWRRSIVHLIASNCWFREEENIQYSQIEYTKYIVLLLLFFLLLKKSQFSNFWLFTTLKKQGKKYGNMKVKIEKSKRLCHLWSLAYHVIMFHLVNAYFTRYQSAHSTMKTTYEHMNDGFGEFM